MNYTFNQLNKMKKNDIINIMDKLNLDIIGNKKKLIYRLINFQKNKNHENNKSFYFNSYSKHFESKNNKIIKNKEERININSRDQNGEYILTEFGKTKKTKKIEKSDFEKFIKDKGLHFSVSDNIFKKALNIFNNIITDSKSPSFGNNKLKNPIQPGYNNTSKKYKLSTINNNIETKNFNEKCKHIKKQYNITSKEKDIFKDFYQKKIQTINPKQCNTKECKKQYIELNKDYTYYMTNC
jgi:hypothetical protein